MYIYMITNNVNGKIYIGQTVNSVKDRFLGHCSHHIIPIDKAIDKYGRENFTVETICEAKSIDELNELEKHYIKKFNSKNKSIGYNCCDGGKNSIGYRHRKDSCEKMSKSRIGIFAGEKNPFYGKHHSPEQIEKWKRDRKGRKLTDEWKQHLSETSPKKRKVICVTTGETFNSLTEASEKYNIEVTHISRVCRGKRKSVKRLCFIYDNTVPSLNES